MVVSVTLRPSAGLFRRVQRLDRSQVPHPCRVLCDRACPERSRRGGDFDFLSTERSIWDARPCCDPSTNPGFSHCPSVSGPNKIVSDSSDAPAKKTPAIRPRMNSPPTSLTLAARFPGLRALAWVGDQLYASRGYELLRARVEDARHVTWQPVAHVRPSLRRRLSVTNRFTARLFRDGFHALAVLPSGAIIGTIPGSIVTLRPGESEFRQTHAITRGTRPLHITTTPGGAVYWGEYFDNAQRDEVHIYASHTQTCRSDASISNSEACRPQAASRKVG